MPAEASVTMAEDLRVTLADELRGNAGGAFSRLEDIVEEASRELGRPVAIDDRQFRLLAYTEHPPEAVDTVRLASVMKRPFPPEVIAWIDKHRARTVEEPIVVPANAELGMDARVCAPIRCHGYLLGYLWLIDRDRSMTRADLARAAAIADEAGIVLYRELLLRDLDRSRERELLRDILSDDERVRDHAVRQLVDSDLFVADGAVCVLVARVEAAADGEPAEAVRLAVDAAVSRMRRTVAPRHSLHLLRPDHALLVVSLADPSVRSRGVQALATRLQEELEASLAVDETEGRHLVTAGGVAEDLAHAAGSYRQALLAANVASTVSSFGNVICWDDLGIYKTLAELPPDALGPGALHPGLQRLIENPRWHFLVRTLECYLDLAGEAQATAAKLYLHRTSLYHRLRRIEQMAGVDLRNGDERLALHLGLKLGRLQGMTWGEPEASET